MKQIYLQGVIGIVKAAARSGANGIAPQPELLPQLLPTGRVKVSNSASPIAARPVERAPRAWIILGLIALVLEGTFAILSLAAVAFITSAFLTRQAAISVRAVLLPPPGRSI